MTARQRHRNRTHALQRARKTVHESFRGSWRVMAAGMSVGKALHPAPLRARQRRWIRRFVQRTFDALQMADT